MRYKEIKQRDPKETVQHFVQYVGRDLGLKSIPEIEYSANKKNESDHNTGWYNPDTETIWVYTGSRNLIDILRTVAHELRHRKQGEEDPGHWLCLSVWWSESRNQRAEWCESDVIPIP